jgi:8-oxo-dGTP diphosphatase
MDEFDFTAQLPAKRMGAGGIFLNADGYILLVQPTYREKWLLPGGIVEANESPGAACVREVKEELGLEVHLRQLLCVEYRCAAPPKTESLQFIFYCGVLTPSQIEHIRLPPDELSAFHFVSLEEAKEKLEIHSVRRIQWAWQALQEQRTVYAENGLQITA